MDFLLNYSNFEYNFSSFYLKIQETLSSMNQMKEKADFDQMENFDLCQALKGTVFNTHLNKLWDIKKVIGNIEIGFARLQWNKCDQQAIYACVGNQETPYKLFCDGHFEKLGSNLKSSINLLHDLRLNVIMLNELERHLIRLQERIEYFSIDSDEKNPDLYQKVKELIEDNFGELKTLLESLASKCLRINHHKAKTLSSDCKMKYEYLSFIKDDCDKCRNTIFKILSMIPEVWDKIETNSLIQVIVGSIEGMSLEEGAKENLISSIPDHIYGKEYQLVHIPTQSFVQFKEFENKIKTNCKIIEICLEVCLNN